MSYEWAVNYATVSHKCTLTQTGTRYNTLNIVGGCDSICSVLTLMLKELQISDSFLVVADTKVKFPPCNLQYCAEQKK